MNGMALLFMLLFWSFILILCTFCMTLIMREQDAKDKKSPHLESLEGKSKG